jgi:hypothetical protein
MIEYLNQLVDCMKELGGKRLYYKILAPNDNSKNQPYFGSSFETLNIIPCGDLEASTSDSTKQNNKSKVKFKAPVNFFWICDDGTFYQAPHSQLIFYPQYPEVRFSGFLKGCKKGPSDLMNPQKQGRAEGRVLIISVTNDDEVYGFIAAPESNISKELHEYTPLKTHGLFSEIQLEDKSNELELLKEFYRIFCLGWIKGKRLDVTSGHSKPCNSANCGGYTLEAELGVFPNGISEPDFLGWEVKQYSLPSFNSKANKVITLMTPEPSGGVYQDNSVAEFIRRFGYPDKSGKPDRLNFGGIHKYNEMHQTTKLRLSLIGYDLNSEKITDSFGGIGLQTESNEIAAFWHFSKLMNHWKKKHAQAIYIPSMCDSSNGKKYSYSPVVKLCEGTDFLKFLKAISLQNIYYDPGIKMENVSTTPKIKRRSQFRVKIGDLDSLYHKVREVDTRQVKF